MKIGAMIARYLLGLMFTVFGLNGFLHFIPLPPPAAPMALQYMMTLGQTHYLVLVYLIQFVGGLLLLSNFYVPLALTILAPVLVNILLFHGLMDPGGLPPGILATVLWLVVFSSVRSAFSGIFQAKV
jgi:hypothetical protein